MIQISDFKILTYGLSLLTTMSFYEMFQKLPDILILLLILIAIDIILGVFQAIKHKKISTQKIYNGGIKKITILLIITLSYFIDLYLLNNPTQYIFNSSILYYIFLELLSITKNANKIGIKLPKALLNLIENLKERE